jgi:esterase/lipase superfamily enzyme
VANVILAAADVHVDRFRQEYALCAPGRTPTAAAEPMWTSYASRNDRALWLSSWLHAGARVGGFDGDTPYTADGLQTIDASSTDASLIALNHSYFGGRPSVLTDIAYLMRHGLPAGQRPPLEPVQRWWRFKT